MRSQIYIRGRCAPYTPKSGKLFHI